MAWVDVVILAIILLSAIISIFRGFVREAFSLAAWLLATWVGWTFRDALAVHLEQYINVPSLRLLVAFAVLFLLTLLIGALLSYMLSQLVQKTGLSGTDRALGFVFGLGRGVVIVAVLVMGAHYTAIPNDPWWQASEFIKHFEVVANQLMSVYQQ